MQNTKVQPKYACYSPSQRSRERATLRLISGVKMWAFINCTLYRFSPNSLHVVRRALVKWFRGDVARTSSLHNKAVITCPWNFKIGNLSSIGEKTWVYSLDRVSIGDKTCVGANVQLLTGSHDISSKTFKYQHAPIDIGSYAWIATSAIVLPGIIIGDGAVVAAGSVVTRDVEPWTVVAGNPARVIKKRVINRE